MLVLVNFQNKNIKAEDNRLNNFIFLSLLFSVLELRVRVSMMSQVTVTDCPIGMTCCHISVIVI